MSFSVSGAVGSCGRRSAGISAADLPFTKPYGIRQEIRACGTAMVMKAENFCAFSVFAAPFGIA